MATTSFMDYFEDENQLLAECEADDIQSENDLEDLTTFFRNNLDMKNRDSLFNQSDWN
jgi:hypothetical protein